MLQVSKCLIGLAVMMLQSCETVDNRRKLKPETYLLQEENGNLFMSTGFRIDVSYNEATDILTFSPNGDYVRVNPKPDHPIGEQ